MLKSITAMEGKQQKNHQKKYLLIIFGLLTLIAIILVVAIIVNGGSRSTSMKDAGHYQNLASEIMDEDTARERGNEAIEYALKADELSQTIDSAIFVLNTASTYHLTDIHQQFLEVLRERQIKNGIDLSKEGAG